MMMIKVPRLKASIVLPGPRSASFISRSQIIAIRGGRYLNHPYGMGASEMGTAMEVRSKCTRKS